MTPLPIFTLLPTNTQLWNLKEFIQFLINHLGQAIQINTNSEGPSLDTIGVYQLLDQFGYTDVRISTNNLIETHNKFQIVHPCPFRFFTVDKRDYSIYHTWNYKKIFGCFYNRPLWYRIGLAATLQHDYSQQSLINIRCNPTDPNQRSLFEIQQLFNYHPNSLTKFISVAKQWPLQLERNDGYTLYNHTTGHTDQLTSFYPEFLIDIVAETWTAGRTFFPTEKTTRPILLKKPFIIFGSKDYLDYLHQMGFKTFCEFWPEDYDGFAEKDRYLKIINLIDTLSKKSIIELQDIYIKMQKILDHNYNLLITGNFNTNIKYINNLEYAD